MQRKSFLPEDFFIFVIERKCMAGRKLLTGIVLAGGKSSRMGQEKGLLFFRGKPLIRYSLNLLKPFCNEIIISANAPAYPSFGYPVFSDEIAGIGPMGGLYTALRMSSHKGNIVVPCDTPFLNDAFLKFLLSALQGQSAVIPVHPDGKVEPLCGYYSKENVPLIEKAIKKGNYTLTDYLKNNGAFFLSMEGIPFYQPRLFANMNTPDDMKHHR